MIGKILCSLYSHRPPLIWGQVGIGKSSLARQIARHVGVRSFVVYLSHKADNEVHGQPVIAREMKRLGLDGKMVTVVEQAPPQYVIEALQVPAGARPGALIVFEELTTIPPTTAAPALAIFSENRIADLDLPDDVRCMACANPSSLAVGGWDLAPPSARRFCHLKFKLDPQEWCASFPGNWGEPIPIGCWGFHVDHEEVLKDRLLVASFIHRFPDSLFQMPKDNARRTGCWMEEEVIQVGGMANPAAWEAVSKHLTVGRTMGLEPSDLQEVVSGTVGQEHASTFFLWKDEMDMPSPATIIEKPALISAVPENRSDKLFYAVMGCTEWVRHLVQQHRHSLGNSDLRHQAVRAVTNCWEVVGRILIGSLGATSYQKALQQVLAGKKKMAGPLDIGAIGARILSSAELQPVNLPIHEIHEIDLVPMVTRTAGVQWHTKGGTGFQAKG